MGSAAHDGLSLRTYGASGGSHAHEHFQVLVGVDGVLDLEVEGRGRRIGAGDGFLVTPGERHDFESAGGSRCLVLDTRLDLWALCGPAPRRADQVGPLARYLSQALLQHQPLAALHGPSLLLEAWLPAAPASAPRRRIDWPALQAWAQSRLDQPLTVAELAARVHLSPSQFALRCHDANGQSVMQWLRAQRLARARQLRAMGLPVAEVARRTGYRSPSALTAALRRSAR
ncbi:MAG: Transcriptional regulator, AraC family [uncultured Ramlibacter sp.]|uniref:Transcriptional regulator, AraC family n=1 Tax=uncultured Ramlibacter sp. TaxID=260755 RepID=A0A6J4NZE7_9BURK|nr:MAG: Transcriptional regulator, AraC family [uncultured Ramlibacter sp.]